MDAELNRLFNQLKVERKFLEPPSDIDIQFNTIRINDEIQTLFSLECSNNNRLWRKLDFCITIHYTTEPIEIVYKIWNIIDAIMF